MGSEPGRGGELLRALIVDDMPDDAVLMALALEAGGFAVQFERVDSAEAMAEALDRGRWDIVLSDHSMPGFGSEQALAMLARADRVPPAILVSGAIGEEAAVAAIRAGAADFVSKDRLVRLPAAVARARKEAALEAERKRLEDELQFNADHDHLSGLFNRRRFATELAEAVAHAERYPDAAGALLLIDLDNFKYINDTLGHRAGDDMLTAISQALRSRLRETDVIARVGGDEFAVVLAHTQLAAALLAARSLCEAARRVVIVAGERKVLTTLSIGVVPLGGGMTGEDSLALVDMAMYEAKRQGRNRAVAFASRPKHGCDELSWAERLRYALRHRRFELYAQPIVEIATGRVDRRELLLRLRDEDGRIVLPGVFMATAERFGLIGEIDRWVVREAIRRLAGHPDRRALFTVNLSGISIGDPALLALIAAEIDGAGVDPARLIFEVTETAAITDLDTARSFMEGLARVGCASALDDFGSGFGSFVYLKHLPVDYIKIDGEFVRHLPGSPQDRALVKAIIDVAHSLGKRTIAEYVGSQAALSVLREHGADFAQGFHLGKPQPLAAHLPAENGRVHRRGVPVR